ncbi:hypothetical protein PACTADRAFT_32196 [Pachysolen tannophilus NRRL Y-2460]|uniref:Ribosomal protein L27/L41, mitochondrial n=1 Tax=Pachysolen tannophilus NRRL Y-2460 TaxID=669874 RepID=A0A1E4TY74_PACTA|nr:hypothetical protein PACTADRAFT_32196 [Pachysolen tannophilus NRRL Y-2460]
MKASTVTQFQQTFGCALKRPWKTYKDGTLFYGTTKSGTKRTPLTTKGGNKNFYKGTRSSGVGQHTKHGGYVIDWAKVRTFVVPEGLKECSLNPYVSSNMPSIKHEFKGYKKGPEDPDLYFEKIKEFIENGKVDYPVSKNFLERG